MESVYREAVRELTNGKQGVLATVVRTKGSTPQKPGAKLWVREDGSAVGTLGGGCVEGDIWYAAKMLLRSKGPAELREYYLNEEIAARDGLICGGTMYFLIDPVYQPKPVLEYATKITQAYDGGNTVALGTITQVPAGSKMHVGAKVFFHENGTQEGTLGTAALDAKVKQTARDLMAYGKCDYLSLDDGTEVFVEASTTPPQLVLMGGGHISKSLAPIAKSLGFRIFVLDDRQEFANRNRYPEAEETIVGSYKDDLEKFPINTNTFVVIATRGHQYDDMAMEAALRSKAGYVGLLGSRRKNILIFEEMFKRGIPEERILSVHAPIGLDIGGRTPQEIAVSIIAEILAVRLGGTGAPMKMDPRLVQKAKEKAH